jgi:hypothetical protein
MKQDRFNVRRALSSMLPLVMMAMSGLILSPRTAWTQELVVKSVAEMKVKQLPTGPLFWRVENFPTLAQAQAQRRSRPYGKAWLFTLGPKGDPTPGGAAVV